MRVTEEVCGNNHVLCVGEVSLHGSIGGGPANKGFLLTKLLKLKRLKNISQLENGAFLSLDIVQIQRLGYKKKVAGEIRGCHENAIAKSFEMSPHMK